MSLTRTEELEQIIDRFEIFINADASYQKSAQLRAISTPYKKMVRDNYFKALIQDLTQSSDPLARQVLGDGLDETQFVEKINESLKIFKQALRAEKKKNYNNEIKEQSSLDKSIVSETLFTSEARSSIFNNDDLLMEQFVFSPIRKRKFEPSSRNPDSINYKEFRSSESPLSAFSFLSLSPSSSSPTTTPVEELQNPRSFNLRRNSTA